MDITLNVKPDVLVSKAGEMSSEKSTIEGLMDEAKNAVTSLTGSWKSEAAEEYQSRFRQLYDDIDALLAILAEHISDLTEAAEIYTNAEAAAKSAIEGLPTSGVI
jgi:WXG100 family type VII secretion target